MLVPANQRRYTQACTEVIQYPVLITASVVMSEEARCRRRRMRLLHAVVMLTALSLRAAALIRTIYPRVHLTLGLQRRRPLEVR